MSNTRVAVTWIAQHATEAAYLIDGLHERIEELEAEVTLVKRNYDADVGFWQQLCAELDPKTAALFLDSPKVSDRIKELETIIRQQRDTIDELEEKLGYKDDE